MPGPFQELPEEMRPVAPGTNEAESSEPCLLCQTFIEWLEQAWPEEARDSMPEFLPRPAVPRIRVHNDQADAMPFCDWCNQVYMQALGRFHVERQQREGQEPRAMAVREQQQLVTPQKRLIVPGMPEFRQS